MLHIIDDWGIGANKVWHWHDHKEVHEYFHETTGHCDFPPFKCLSCGKDIPAQVLMLYRLTLSPLSLQ